MNKYHARRTQSDGRSFHSKGESDCYAYLKLLQNAGEITDLECQVTVRLGPNNRRWIMDFKYWDVALEAEVWADFKGFETDRWFHLLDLWALGGPGLLRVYKGYGLRMQITQEVNPKSYGCVKTDTLQNE